MNNFGPVIAPSGGIFRYNRHNENLEAYTRTALIKKLIDYRTGNNFKLGDPERDVDQEIAKNHGISSGPVPTGKIAEQPMKKLTLTERVGAWIATRYAKLGALAYVGKTEAERRAKICMACPMNKDWRSSCARCSHQVPVIERNTMILTQNKRTQHFPRLMACAAAGHENRVAIWLTPKFLQHARAYDRNKYPKLHSKCWIPPLLK